jgi:hypothetical protein
MDWVKMHLICGVRTHIVTSVQTIGKLQEQKGLCIWGFLREEEFVTQRRKGTQRAQRILGKRGSALRPLRLCVSVLQGHK